MGEAPRLGFGVRAAVVVVDFARGWTDRAASPMAGDFDAPVEACARLLDAARAAGAPVAFTIVAYDEDELDANLLLRKTPRVRVLVTGSPLVEVDPRLAPREGELVLVKKHASAFFGTPLEAELRARGVDTILLAGCITSGCIRTTAADAAQLGFRPLVVREAVGDRDPAAHEAALAAIDALYGDVVALAEAVAHLEAAR
jgi:nicotinamidase-related amidase